MTKAYSFRFHNLELQLLGRLLLTNAAKCIVFAVSGLYKTIEFETQERVDTQHRGNSQGPGEALAQVRSMDILVCKCKMLFPRSACPIFGEGCRSAWQRGSLDNDNSETLCFLFISKGLPGYDCVILNIAENVLTSRLSYLLAHRNWITFLVGSFVSSTCNVFI